MATIKGLHAFLIKEQFRKTLEKEGYDFFGLKNKKPWNVNIIGVRSEVDMFNKFDDALVVIYRDAKANWEVRSYPITTDPGKVWTSRPPSSKGVAILVPGQYKGAYKIDLHRGKYEALCQRGNVVQVYRDNDLDEEYDRDAGSIDEGWHGINIHRSRESGEAELINSYSAGCQVFKKAVDFSDFMELIKRSANNYGNSFTYTLLTEGDLIGY
tara:strand:+ start:8971 stop:9606 length:636 start_codon:yes stop_codon:yes gene_type:complete